MRKSPRHPVLIAFLAILATGCTDRASTVEGGAAPVPFDAGVEGLPDAQPSRIIEAGPGDTVRMKVQWVAKWIAGRKVRMLGYDGSIPGPTLKVPQGATITLLLTNETGLPTSLHSHGVRLDQSQDGMPGLTQPPIDSGATYAYTLRFPDPGVYWYHPHVREDYGLELGLYGNYWVVPRDPDYWPPVHREVMLMLDDILLEGDALRPFYRNRVDHTLMGRFGNVFLVNGDTAFTMKVKEGEVIRFFATNASGARVFNLEMTPLKTFHVVGADNGRYEYSTLRESDIIAPSERLVFQVLFKKDMRDDDTVRLFHRYQRQGTSREVLLATFIHDGDTAEPELVSSMEPLMSPHIAAGIDSVRGAFDRLPDRVLEMTGTMDMSGLAKKAHDPDNTDYMGIEWYDEMGLMSTGSHDRNTSWILRDDETGKENHAIDWAFKRGDPVLIRIHNDPFAVHAMPHPLHFHGQRFLVVREQGKPQKDNLVWRDSYLIGRGFTVDILLEASNPGEWMMHCHIPEHLGAQMMGHFRVVDAPPARPSPHPWSLSLTPDAGGPASVFAGDSALTARAAGEFAGRVLGYDPAVLAPEITVLKSAYIRKPFTVSLDAQGGFRFPFDAHLGSEVGPMTLHFSPRSTDPSKRPFPHKIRVAFNRAALRLWSLDLDLSGEAVFTGLDRDTSAEGAFEGDFTGKVNGFDPAVFEDTVTFVNVQFPEASTVKAPLSPDGGFAFPAVEVLGGSDGSIFIDILLKPRSGYAADPVKIQLVCNRNLDG